MYIPMIQIDLKHENVNDVDEQQLVCESEHTKKSPDEF